MKTKNLTILKYIVRNIMRIKLDSEIIGRKLLLIVFFSISNTNQNIKFL